MSNKVGEDIVIYAFSDESDWVKKNLKCKLSIIISDANQGDCSYEDLRLMSACRHNIIVNSTFSWWGAWLNPNPDKIVVAPRSWFRRPQYDKDIVPSQWHRVAIENS